MMRCGKSLGTLNWVTDKIYLMRSIQSDKLSDDEDYLDAIKSGSYIK